MDQGQYQNVTLNGLTELLDILETQPYLSIIDQETLSSIAHDRNPSEALHYLKEHYCALQCSLKDPKSIRENMDGAIKDYYIKLNTARTNQEKIQVIAAFIHHLEMLHAFEDGNCRTLVMLLLNKLLLEKKLSPVMLENPNRFDLYSLGELCSEIRAGQMLFQQYKSAHETASILYLHGNKHIAHAMAIEVMTEIGKDYPIDEKDKHKAIHYLTMALQRLDDPDGLDINTQRLIKESLKDSVVQSFYHAKKWTSLYRVDEKTCRIHFDNNTVQAPSLSVVKLTEHLNYLIAERQQAMIVHQQNSPKGP